MSDLTLVSGSEFENFWGVECDCKSAISQNVPNLGFLKFFSQNLYDFCQCRNFCHVMDSSQTDVKIIQEKICRTVKSTWKICIVNEI